MRQPTICIEEVKALQKVEIFHVLSNLINCMCNYKRMRKFCLEKFGHCGDTLYQVQIFQWKLRVLYKVLTCMYTHTTLRAADELATAVFLQIRGGQVSFRAAGEAHLWNQWHGPLIVSSFSCRIALPQADYITLYRRNGKVHNDSTNHFSTISSQIKG